MKKSCKNIDITDCETVYPWVLDCITRHRNKLNFQRLLVSIGGLTQTELEAVMRDKHSAELERAAQMISAEACKRIRIRNLGLKPVRIKEMIDKSSGKTRLIGCESAMQQVFDYIAVYSCRDIWKRRIIPQQASSMPKRGQVYGTKMIRKWICDDNRAVKWSRKHNVRYARKCRYFVKIDAEKCFPNARLHIFMQWFRRDCANRDILWLWEELLKSHRVSGYEGFMIGALPSQWAVQYLMSFIYRFAMSLHSVRREKRIKWVSHSLIFMDDILLLSSSRKNLKRAVEKIVGFAKISFGMTIKSNWQICDIDKTPIDMMGYVVHNDGTITVRPRVFLRVRRMALRYASTRRFTFCQARHTISYKGYFISNKLPLSSRKALENYNLIELFNLCRHLVGIKARKEIIKNGSRKLRRN